MVATNIAETSITIDGIIHVIDSCFVKMAWFNSDTYTDSLIITEVYIHRLSYHFKGIDRHRLLSLQRCIYIYKLSLSLQTQNLFIITEVWIQTQTLLSLQRYGCIHRLTYHNIGIYIQTQTLIIT